METGSWEVEAWSSELGAGSGGSFSNVELPISSPLLSNCDWTKAAAPQRPPGVAGRARTILFLERRPPINLAVRDRVHRATARECEIIGWMLFVQRLEQREECFLVGCLYRARDIFVFLLQRFVRLARRTEKIDQRSPIKCADCRRAILPAVRNVADVVPEKFQVQPETAVGLNAYDFTKLFEIVRLAVRRESHHFVFVAVMREAEKLSERGVKNA